MGSWKGRDHLEDLGISGRIILKWIINWMVWHVLDLFGAGRGRRWVVVNTFMNLPIPKYVETFFF